MSIPRVVPFTSSLLLVCLASVAASAQPLGTFRWQLQPYCNVLTVTVVQQGAQYQLDGTDDQCGAEQRASVTGLAFLNPNGSVGLGLSVVTAPGGVPVHIDATISMTTLDGTWRDSAGVSGMLVRTPGPATSGSPRPQGGIGLSAIDPAQVQARVSGACPAGQLMTQVNQDGSVGCTTVAGAGGGDITGVLAGAGLTGGGLSGAVALAVNFAGTGTAATAARSDHTHAEPETNSTRVGALALAGVTTGAYNTAVGSGTLELTTTGAGNTAVGAGALYGNVGGHDNVGIGAGALSSNVSGNANTAMGMNALANSRGILNLGIGYSAGWTLVNGDNNIYIGTGLGQATESNTTYIGNIFGSTSSSGAAVFVNAAGKLGTVTSSARFKEEVASLDNVGRLLQALRPVSFYYTPEFDDGTRVRQYGLIAEEVAEVMPDLVIRDDAGAVQSVRYHFLPPLLLAEVQRLERERAALARQVAEQAAAIAELRTLLDGLREKQ